MNINKRIIKYLEFKGISQRAFSAKMELSEGILRRGSNLGSTHFKKLKQIFPDLNIGWLLFEEGEMILKDYHVTSEPDEIYTIDSKNELIILQKEQIRIQNELLDAKETIIKLTNSIHKLKTK